MVSAFYRAKNVIKVFCKGKGIPVVEHDKEKMYVPSLVFCHLLHSTTMIKKKQSLEVATVLVAYLADHLN
jgi:DNA gyrase/topoisomerase IV subunit B